MSRISASPRDLLRRTHRDQRGQSLVIVLSLITLLFLLGSALAVHASVALRATRTSAGQGNNFYAADAATELGIWWQRNGKAGNPPAQTINGVTTSTTITTALVACPAAPNPVWIWGNEDGYVNDSDGTGGWTIASVGAGATVSSAVARTGTYSLQIAAANSVARADKDFTNVPIAVVRFAIRLASLPVADVDLAHLHDGLASGSQYHAFLSYQSSTQKLAVRFGQGTPVEAATTVTAGTWYVIDWRANMGTNPRTSDWQIDGVAQPQVSLATPATSVSSLFLGTIGRPPSIFDTYTAYYDDIMISATTGDYPIGELKVSALVPDGMGTNNGATNLQNNDGTAINATTWQRLDEIPVNNETDYVKQVTSSGTSYVELTFQDTTQTCLRGVGALTHFGASGSSTNNGKTSIFDGATERIVYSGDMGVTGIGRYGGPVIAPATAPWSQSAVNGLKARIGYSTDVSPVPYWYNLMLEYGWQPQVPTVIVQGTGGGSTVTTTYPDAGAGVPTLSTWTTTK